MAHIHSSSVSNAVFNNDLIKLAELINIGKRIDIQDNLGYTPLHIAAKKLRHGAITMLLGHPDCPINELSFEGCTSLYLICEHKSPCLKIVKELLTHGADPNLHNLELMSPLHLACKNENLELVKLLLEHGANINAQELDYYTPLHFTVEGHDKRIVEYLLQKNADTNITNCHGLNALMLAIVRNKEELIDVILPFTKNLNTPENLNDSAVILGIKMNNLNIVRKLVENGTNICHHGALGCINLYETEKLEIFKYIWEKQNYKTVADNTYFIIKLLSSLTAISNLENLKIIFETEDINLKSVFRRAANAFGNIFSVQTKSPCLSYFETSKESLIIVIKGLLKQDIQINDKNLEIFMNFIKICPYRKYLLKMVLRESGYIIYPNLLLTALLLDSEMGVTLLQNCPYYFNPNDIFRKITPGNFKAVKYIFPYFSPNFVVINQLEISYNTKFNDKYKRFSCKPHSLVELSRNVARKYIGQNISNGGKNKLFWEGVDNLSCPNIIKDIILLKKPINKHTL